VGGAAHRGLTCLVGLALGSWGEGPASLGNLLFTAALSVVIGGFVDAIARQSEQRRDALAALAATRAELAENARHAGVLEERERLSRELHDTLAQSFTSVVTHLEAAEQALDERPAEARRHVDTARRTARDGLADVRRSVRALRPTCSRTRGCRGRWSGWCAAGRATPVCRRSCGRRPQPHAPSGRRHGAAAHCPGGVGERRPARPASRVVVSLSYLEDVVTLDVDDDGVGFDGTPEPRPDGASG
jgi:signal transduction histidine kinase